MIFFDYGNTLVYEKVDKSPEAVSGIIDVLNEDIDPELLHETINSQKTEYNNTLHPKNLEYSYVDLFEKIFKKLGITSEKSYTEISKIYFDDYAPGFPMDGAVDLLNYLEGENIPYGVISNLSWSGGVLRQRLFETLDKDIKYVYTSSDFNTRKPDVEIFNIAKKLSGINGEEMYYVGDNPLCDIVGGRNAGFKPIFFQPKTENVFMRNHEKVELDFPHYEIDDLREVIDILRGSENYGL